MSKTHVNAVFWSSKKYYTDNLEIKSSTTVRKSQSSVRRDGLVITVTPVLRDGLARIALNVQPTLHIQDGVTRVFLDGRERCVTSALRVGLDRVATLVTDSDSAQKATALNVSRMATGKENG